MMVSTQTQSQVRDFVNNIEMSSAKIRNLTKVTKFQLRLPTTKAVVKVLI